MNELVFIDMVTIALGSCALFLSVILGFKFRNTNILGHHISFLLFAEAYGVFATLFFSVAAVTGLLHDLNGYFQAMLRMSIFLTAMISTYRLWCFLDLSGGDDG